MRLIDKLTSVLFNQPGTISICGKDIQLGKRYTDPEAKARDIRDRYDVPSTKPSTMSKGATIIKAICEGELSLAVDSTHMMLYGEYHHHHKDGSVSHWIFLAKIDGSGNVKVTYLDEHIPEDRYDELLPYIAAEMFLRDDTNLAACLALACGSFTGTNPDADLSAAAFCDGLYYKLIKAGEKGEEFETQVIINDCSFALEEIKAAKQMGQMCEFGDDTYSGPMPLAYQMLTEAGIEFTPCENLKDVASPGTRSRKKEKAKKTKAEEIRAKILAGEFFIPYAWNEEQQAHIPPLSFFDDYTITEAFIKVLLMLHYSFMLAANAFAIDGQVATELFKQICNVINVLLIGIPGTGKTTMAFALAAALGFPIYSIKFTEDSEDDVFQGMNKIINGKLSFKETDFLYAFAHGGIIILEEINLGRPNVMTGALNQALEYPYYIEKNGYEKVYRSPFTAIIGTMNPETEGTMPLNSALAQRFSNKFLVSEPTAAELKAQLRAKGFPKDRVEHVVGVYLAVRDYLKENSQREKYLKEISIRQCLATLQDVEYTSAAMKNMDMEEPDMAELLRQAIKDTVYGAFYIKNRKLADAVKEAVLDTYPNYRGE